MTDTRVATRLGELAVRVTGDGPPAVLWHGMFVDSTVWDRAADELASYRQLILVDGPGHGRSDPLTRTSSVAECAIVARELLDGLGIDEPVDWIGSAWGGHVGFALTMAGSPVVRSLVAISSPTTPIASDLRRRIRLLIPLLRIAGMRGAVRSAILESQLTDASRSDPAIVGLVDAAIHRPAPASLARAVRSFILDRVDVSPGLERIAVPALFVASDDRGDWSAEESAADARRVPNARAVLIPGARTLIPLERPGQLASEILRFWNT